MATLVTISTLKYNVNRGLTTEQARRVLKASREGLGDMRLHDLRHTCMSLLRQDGLIIYAIKRQDGTPTEM
ncbi:hypothetical protein ABT294_42530 [Nonomuraea sp. NPDC000554]|uniref:hypothetical protein n=1 Tax=Nonomuraea sp. NPDC000554 TaxID=3154259 RepID=UPI00331B23C3